MKHNAITLRVTKEIEWLETELRCKELGELPGCIEMPTNYALDVENIKVNKK